MSGIKKCINDQSSIKLFCSGVPVSSNRLCFYSKIALVEHLIIEKITILKFTAVTENSIEVAIAVI